MNIPEKLDGTEPVYPGFWKRVIADLIDSSIVDLASVLMTFIFLGAWYWVGVLLRLESVQPEARDFFFREAQSTLILLVLVLSRGIFALLYYSLGHYRYGTTFGKIIFHIYVVSTEGMQPLTLRQAYLRTLHYITSYLTFYVGFLMVIFHPQKRALHDLLANTVSIVRRKA
ncbi:MAG: RDD family protein [Bdellovibrio sp.]|nr:RDD family protein [Bdellovibrio sp.]